VLKVKIPISKLRGNCRIFAVSDSCPRSSRVPVAHPGRQRLVWADIQEVMKYLGMPIPRRGGSGS